MAADVREIEEVRRSIELERAELVETLGQLESMFASRLVRVALAATALAVLGLSISVGLHRRRRHAAERGTVAGRLGRYALVRLP
jgi:hypothetical protein